MPDSLPKTPTTHQLLRAVHDLMEEGLVQRGKVSRGRWIIVSNLPGREGGTQSFRAPEELSDLATHLRKAYGKVALFQPVFEARNGRKSVAVNRDFLFRKMWMVVRKVRYFSRERHEGHLPFASKDEGKEYARQWLKRRQIFFSKEEFRNGPELL